jgi:hypothetical protein
MGFVCYLFELKTYVASQFSRIVNMVIKFHFVCSEIADDTF